MMHLHQIEPGGVAIWHGAWLGAANRCGPGRAGTYAAEKWYPRPYGRMHGMSRLENDGDLRDLPRFVENYLTVHGALGL